MSNAVCLKHNKITKKPSNVFCPICDQISDIPPRPTQTLTPDQMRINREVLDALYRPK